MCDEVSSKRAYAVITIVTYISSITFIGIGIGGLINPPSGYISIGVGYGILFMLFETNAGRK